AGIVTGATVGGRAKIRACAVAAALARPTDVVAGAAVRGRGEIGARPRTATLAGAAARATSAAVMGVGLQVGAVAGTGWRMTARGAGPAADAMRAARSR